MDETLDFDLNNITRHIKGQSPEVKDDKMRLGVVFRPYLKRSSTILRADPYLVPNHINQVHYTVSQLRIAKVEHIFLMTSVRGVIGFNLQ